MRLIDADAELKKLDEMEIEGATFVTAVSFAKLVLLNAPTAGTQSVVRHGHWIIPRFGADAKCSVCGMYYSDVYDMESKDHYCRNCGAKMDGDQND